MDSIVPQGYKQTKIGVIPEEWEVVKLKNITKIETGKTPLRTNKLFWENGNINWVTTTEVNKTYITKSSEKITDFALNGLKMKLMPIDTILLAMYGQGKTRGKVALLKIESTINQAFASIKPHKHYSTNFLFNYLDKSYMKIRNLSHGSNQDNLNLDTIKYLDIPFPPLKEQQKIAKILTTWDDAISKQEKLIKAKEQLKKGLMQKLLSGEVRFDGFSGEWKKMEFEFIFDRIANKKYRITSDKYLKIGKYPVIDRGKKDIIAYSDEEEKLFKNKSIILFGDHTRIIKYIDFDFIVGADGTQLITTKDNFNNKFFYYQLSNKRIPNTGYNRHFKFIKDMIFKLPPLQEQQKIAQVLSTADKEVDLLKKELESLKEQKKGLMQRLLSGEVRVKI